jgi:hypothetical protein
MRGVYLRTCRSFGFVLEKTYLHHLSEIGPICVEPRVSFYYVALVKQQWDTPSLFRGSIILN